MNARKKAKLLQREYKKLKQKLDEQQFFKCSYQQIDPWTLGDLEMYKNLCKYMMLVGIGTRSGMRISEEMLHEASKKQIDWERELVTNSIIVRCK